MDALARQVARGSAEQDLPRFCNPAEPGRNVHSVANDRVLEGSRGTDRARDHGTRVDSNADLNRF